jgi:hypothetical protein
MVSALVASGLREQALRHRAKALELWNRALAFDPDNHAVLAELRRLERGERLRRWLIGGAAAGVLAAMAGGAFLLARKALDSRRTQAALTSPTQSRPATAGPVLQVAAATPSPVARPAAAQPRAVGTHASRESRRHEAPPGERPGRGDDSGKTADNTGAESITLSLGFTPARVEVWMDGKKAFDYGPDQNRIQIPWNRPHRLEFRNDTCCNRKEVVVGPEVYRPAGDHLFVNLDPKPARLLITVEPPTPGTSVLVREVNDAKAKPWRARVQPGERVPVPFDAGDEMRKSLELVVFKGDKTTTSQVTITAGETRPITIHLDD